MHQVESHTQSEGLAQGLAVERDQRLHFRVYDHSEHHEHLQRGGDHCCKRRNNHQDRGEVVRFDANPARRHCDPDAAR